MSNQNRKYRYVTLLLSAVDLQPGQNLLIRAEPIHWDFCNLLAEAAYKAGAHYVHVIANHGELSKARIDHAPEESLDYVPEFVRRQYSEFADGNWAVIALNGPEDPDLMKSVDSARSGRIGKASAEALREFRDKMQRDRFAWCVAALPTPKWAAKVFDTEPSQEAVDRLWKVMEPILRLDRDSPTDEWHEHARMLKARARRFSEMNINLLHFQAEDTDLKVGLLPGSVWIGGGGEKPDGRTFLPNVPTEEVFTTPHRMHAEGTAKVTRPVLVLGKIVEGAWFEFEGGRVQRFGADKGRDVLEQYFAIDENADRLGEIALVDSSSPVFESGTVFFNILYDENAACHMALGSSYPGCMAGSDSLSDEQYVQAGGNRSNLHTDFMIGSPDISVTAETADGSSVALMRDGRFV